jgi:hypothetical protein
MNQATNPTRSQHEYPATGLGVPLRLFLPRAHHPDYSARSSLNVAGTVALKIPFARSCNLVAATERSLIHSAALWTQGKHVLPFPEIWAPDFRF